MENTTTKIYYITFRQIIRPKKRIARKEKDETRGKRLLREKVPDTKFLLNKMRWSPWQLVVSPEHQLSNASGSDWDLRTATGRTKYWRKRTVCKPINSPTLFEVAVQMKPRKKRIVVYYKFITRLPDSRKWEQRLLGSCSGKIDSVMKGYKIFVRSAAICRRSTTKLQKSKNILKLYNYAWCKHKDHVPFRI